LIEEFKREINRAIRRKLMGYERVVNLDRYWRESRQEKERLRERWKIGAQAPRTNILANSGETQRQ